MSLSAIVRSRSLQPREGSSSIWSSSDKVEPGQKIAIQRNSFGDVVAEYTSSVAGEITGQRSDAMSEPGNPLAFILFRKATPDGGETYPE
jgi:predicted deacylase